MCLCACHPSPTSVLEKQMIKDDESCSSFPSQTVPDRISIVHPIRSWTQTKASTYFSRRTGTAQSCFLPHQPCSLPCVLQGVGNGEAFQQCSPQVHTPSIHQLTSLKLMKRKGHVDGQSESEGKREKERLTESMRERGGERNS